MGGKMEQHLETSYIHFILQTKSQVKAELYAHSRTLIHTHALIIQLIPARRRLETRPLTPSSTRGRQLEEQIRCYELMISTSSSVLSH